MIGVEYQYTEQFESKLEVLKDMRAYQLTSEQRRQVRLYRQRVRKRKSRINQIKAEQQVKEDCSLEMVG